MVLFLFWVRSFSFLDAIASLAMPCNLGHSLTHSLRHSQSCFKSPLLPLRFIRFRYGRVKEGPLWSWRVHAGQGVSMRVMQGPWGPWRVHELQGGFNEVLVGFMEGLEIEEGSIRVIVFPWMSCRVHEGHVRSMRVIEDSWASRRINECLVDCLEVKEKLA